MLRVTTVLAALAALALAGPAGAQAPSVMLTVVTSFAMEVTDSAWHHQLSAREDGHEAQPDPYWLWPFQNYKTFCPYLVGSHERVADELRLYLENGFRTFILDIPRSPDDLHHSNLAFERARDTLKV